MPQFMSKYIGILLSPCSKYRAVFHTGGSYCTMCALCNARNRGRGESERAEEGGRFRVLKHPISTLHSPSSFSSPFLHHPFPHQLSLVVLPSSKFLGPKKRNLHRAEVPFHSVTKHLTYCYYINLRLSNHQLVRKTLTIPYLRTRNLRKSSLM